MDKVRYAVCLLIVVLFLLSCCRVAAVFPDMGVTNETAESYFKRTSLYIGECRTTFYCACFKCCGKDESHPGYGVTASGERVQAGRTIAVDPAVIPLGSDVLLRWSDGNYAWRVATDTGVRGKSVDVYMEEHDAALRAGVQVTDVWWRE